MLKARVRAVPEKGGANRALKALLADALGVAPSAVSVEAGVKSRLKTMTISGNPKLLLERLHALVGSG